MAYGVHVMSQDLDHDSSEVNAVLCASIHAHVGSDNCAGYPGMTADSSDTRQKQR